MCLPFSVTTVISSVFRNGLICVFHLHLGLLCLFPCFPINFAPSFVYFGHNSVVCCLDFWSVMKWLPFPSIIHLYTDGPKYAFWRIRIKKPSDMWICMASPHLFTHGPIRTTRIYISLASSALLFIWIEQLRESSGSLCKYSKRLLCCVFFSEIFIYVPSASYDRSLWGNTFLLTHLFFH
jgi:hypothetical protein